MQLSTVLSLLLSASAAFATPTPTVEERNTACSPVGISTASSAAVVSAFKSSGVVPTLIPSIVPKVAVQVAYGSKQVKLGNTFKTTQTTTQPSLSFSKEAGYSTSTKYSYFLIDPDVPNPDAGALRKTYLHWAVSNAQPSCVTTQSQKTDTVYQALTPASTQQHRYTFLVYRQPAGYTPDDVALQVRTGFDINSYASAHGLTLVGGNFLREAITNT